MPSKKELLQVVSDNERPCVERGGAIANLIERGMDQAAIAAAVSSSRVSPEYVGKLLKCFQNLGSQASQMCRDGRVNRDACCLLANPKNTGVDQAWVLDRAKELGTIRDAQRRRGRRTPPGKITTEDMKQAIKEAREGAQSKRAETRPSPRQFDVVIERDEEGFYIASVPALLGCHTQARSLDEVTDRIREAIELCLEVSGNQEGSLEFVGIQRVTVAA
jgi:predicted RNase H-like HicB family nuclease